MEQLELRKPLIDLISKIKNNALKTKKEVDKAKKEQRDFLSGKIMGYYFIVTLFKHQASVFLMDQKELNLSQIDPERDLLGLRKNPDLDPIEWPIDVINDETIKGYIRDSLFILKEQYLEAKKSLKDANECDKEYNRGEFLAYREIIDLMKSQVRIFHVDEKDISLADVEPERDFL